MPIVPSRPNDDRSRTVAVLKIGGREVALDATCARPELMVGSLEKCHKTHTTTLVKLIHTEELTVQLFAKRPLG